MFTIEFWRGWLLYYVLQYLLIAFTNWTNVFFLSKCILNVQKWEIIALQGVSK